MAEYSELIKRFDKIRDYMRDFYIYGFKARNDFKSKSSRSYDNEKRRIESYLSEYMSFRHDENGKNMFISVDHAYISSNPLYRAFKAKTFTKNDIMLNFYIIDILTDNECLTAGEVVEIISKKYTVFFENPISLDIATIRNKLKEYEAIGLLVSNTSKKKLCYSLNKSDINISEIYDALLFFSEISPLGVVGSYLIDKCDNRENYLTFKHHYIMHALETEIVELLLKAINDGRYVELINHNQCNSNNKKIKIIPLRILISVQGGRRYLAAFDDQTQKFFNYRLDCIKEVKISDKCNEFDIYRTKLKEILEFTWGVSYDNHKKTEKLVMTLHITHKENYIIERIEREGRNGTLAKINDTTYKYEVLVYDVREMMTWIRSFIGRIVKLECDNKNIERIFHSDLNRMYQIYLGGELDDIQ